FLLLPPPLRSTLFPYTTLFRSIASVAALRRVDPLDPAAVAALAVELGADLLVVGPEAPLVAGVGDAVRAAGIPVFGPSKAAAQLDRKSTRLNSSHSQISYAVFC